MAAIQDGLHTTTLEKLVPFGNNPNTPPTQSTQASFLRERGEVGGMSLTEGAEHKGVKERGTFKWRETELQTRSTLRKWSIGLELDRCYLLLAISMYTFTRVTQELISLFAAAYTSA